MATAATPVDPTHAVEPFALFPLASRLASLRAFVLSGLSLDLFEGSAWVSITPFEMSRVALRGIPEPARVRVPGTQCAHLCNGRRPTRDLVFLSRRSSAIAVIASRAAYRLPYHRASMAIADAGSSIDFRSIRRSSRLVVAQLHVKYAKGTGAAPAVAGSLDAFLVERYCLYAVDSRQRVYRGEIHHRSWLLHNAEADIHTNSYAAINGIQLPPLLPLCHYSEMIDVVAYPLQRI